MGSLSGCGKKLGFQKEELTAIREEADNYKNDGHSAPDSIRLAVSERIQNLREERSHIIEQIKSKVDIPTPVTEDNKPAPAAEVDSVVKADTIGAGGETNDSNGEVGREGLRDQGRQSNISATTGVLVPDASAGTHAEIERGIERLAKSVSNDIGRDIVITAGKERAGSDDGRRISEALGRDLIYIQNHSKDIISFQAAVIDDKSIFVDEDSNKPHLFILGHELMHTIKKYDERNGTTYYTEFAEELKKLIDFRSYVEISQQKRDEIDGWDMSPEMVYDEIVGDFIGDRFTDKSFWEKLFKKAPGIVHNVMKAIKALIDEVKGHFRKTDAIFTDLQKAENIAADFLSRHLSMVEKGTIKKEDSPSDFASFLKNKLKDTRGLVGKDIDAANSSEFTPEEWDRIAKEAGTTVDDVKEILGYSEPVVDLLTKDAISNEPFITSTKNAVVEEERAARGLDPVEQHMKFTDPVMYAEGMRLINSQAFDPRTMAESLAAKPRPINAAEQMALLHDRVAIRNESNTVMDMILEASAKGDTQKVLELRQRMAKLEDDFSNNEKAAKYAGTEWSASGRARQLMMAEDYSYIRVSNRAKVAIGKKELTPELQKRIEELTQQLAAATEKLTGYEEKIAELEAKKWVQREINKSTTRTQRRTYEKKVVDDEFKTLKNTWAQMMTGNMHSMGITTEQAAVLIQLAKNRLISGVKSAEEIVSDIYYELKDVSPAELEPRDIRDAISGYGKTFKMSQDEIAKEIREIKQQMRLVSAYEDASAGEMPLRTGLQRDPISDETRELQKKVKQAMRESGIANVDGRSPEDQWKSAIDAVKTRLKNQIHDLTQQLETGEKTPKKIGIEYDAEAKEMQAERDRLREALQAVEGKPEMSPEQRLVVALNAVRKNISGLERQINERDVEVKAKENKTPETSELKELRDKRDALKSKRDEMREAVAEMKKQGAPDEDPEITRLNKFMKDTERKIATAEKAVKRSIEEYNRRLSEGDIAPTKHVSSTPETPELKAMREKRDALKAEYKAMQEEAQPKLTDEEQYLKVYKARMAKRMLELQNKLDTGDFEKAPKKSYRLDPEAQTLKADVGKLKNQIEIEIRKLELANRTKLEKGLDWAYKIRRGVLLSGVGTLEKLAAAATIRSFVTNPIEEGIGTVLRMFPLISDIDAQAPREGGGMSVRAEAASFKQWFMKETWKDSLEVIKTGHGELDSIYGHHKDIEPPEWIEFFGRVHGAMKNPAKRAEFSRSLQKRSEWAIRNNMDLSEPDVMAAVTGGAYIDGLRTILMDDNSIVKGYRMMLRFMESKGDMGKIMSTAIQLGIPIVKIPTNFAAEVGLHMVGIPYAGYLATQSAKEQDKKILDALKSLPPDEADKIMRAMKKNIFGLILLALGIGFAEYIGGFWQRGEKRKHDDPKAGEIKVGNARVGSHLQHQPQMQTVQAGATMVHVRDSYKNAKKKGKDEEGYKTDDIYHGEGKPGAEVASIMAVFMGVLKTIPFIDTPYRVLEAAKSYESGKSFANQQIESLIVPPTVRQVAKGLDTYNDVVVPRDKSTLANVMKSSIPGLRKDVPIDVKKIKRMDATDLNALLEVAPTDITDTIERNLTRKKRIEMNQAKNGLSR